MASNRFEYALRFGDHTIDKEVAKTLFRATDAEPGSPEKIEVLAKRCALGQPLWHENDRIDYHGVGLIKLADRLIKERE